MSKWAAYSRCCTYFGYSVIPESLAQVTWCVPRIPRSGHLMYPRVPCTGYTSYSQNSVQRLLSVFPEPNTVDPQCNPPILPHNVLFVMSDFHTQVHCFSPRIPCTTFSSESQTSTHSWLIVVREFYIHYTLLSDKHQLITVPQSNTDFCCSHRLPRTAHLVRCDSLRHTAFPECQAQLSFCHTTDLCTYYSL